MSRGQCWMNSEDQTVAYRPQLDALRGIAIVGVLESHFLSDGATGPLGVRLFFVLSGFLITNILLTIRLEGSVSGGTMRLMRNFLIRRALRIWPAYYLLITLLLITNAQDFRSVAVWHALFASNILFF